MKYLLTEQEYYDLKHEGEDKIEEFEDKLQTFCTWVAENTPVKYWGNDVAKIWECILPEDSINHQGYCDCCPSRDICPCDHKSWSK